MKKNLLLLILSAVIVAFYSAEGSAINYVNYENSDYNYRIIIPGTWKKTVTSDKTKHVLILTNNFNTSVKIEVLKSGGDIEKTIHERKWCLRQVDSSVKSIIETPVVTLRDNASGKLLVFEYFSNSSRFLHRTFFSENGGMTYIVECKSPVWNFYKVEEIFNTAFASFGYLSVEKVAEAVEAKPSPEAGKKESIQSKKDDDEDLEDDENGSDEDADDELDEEDE